MSAEPLGHSIVESLTSPGGNEQMPPTYILARDHLEQAASILRDGDARTRELRAILERIIALLAEFERCEPYRDGNVVDFQSVRYGRRRERP